MPLIGYPRSNPLPSLNAFSLTHYLEVQGVTLLRRHLNLLNLNKTLVLCLVAGPTIGLSIQTSVDSLFLKNKLEQLGQSIYILKDKKMIKPSEERRRNALVQGGRVLYYNAGVHQYFDIVINETGSPLSFPCININPKKSLPLHLTTLDQPEFQIKKQKSEVLLKPANSLPPLPFKSVLLERAFSLCNQIEVAIAINEIVREMLGQESLLSLIEGQKTRELVKEIMKTIKNLPC